VVDKRAASHSLGLRIPAAASVAIGLQRGGFMRHHLALVVCLAVIGSSAHAAPSRHGGRHAKAKKHAADDEAEAPRRAKRTKHKDTVHRREDVESDRVAFRSETIDEDSLDEEDSEDDVDEDDMVGDSDDSEPAELDAPVRIRKQARAKKQKDWHVAIGPYLWASSVDADVSLGSSTVSAGVDFFEVTRHAKYGVELLAEASYKRFSIYGDLLYGVVGVSGDRTVGPLMVTLDGTASTLLVDGMAGYRLAGGDHDRVTLEARAGVRYQRTAVAGSLDISGNEVAPSVYVDAAADALAGAHIGVRPFDRLFVSGTLDVGIFGDSSLTWSASVDASVRITSHARLSLGWRTLTTARTNVSIVMHGPRAALQLLF
jgi:hypothetical protein